MKKNTALLISCTIGYGHQAAAMNIEQRLRAQNPDLNIILLDTKNFLSPLAVRVSSHWDDQLRKGNFILTRIVPIWGVYEKIYTQFFDGNIARHIAQLFEEHHITAVYDMQPLFTASFYKAFSKVCLDRSLVYHKILTDLPTPRNISFLGGIKRTPISTGQINLKLHAPEPILGKQQTSESFWKQHCRLPLSQIDDAFALPVHINYLNPPENASQLKLDIHSDWALDLSLSDDAHVTALMLGSQGGNAIYDYVKIYLAQLSKQSPTQPHYLFIACSKNEALYAKLKILLEVEFLKEPSIHRIIPLKMQTMEAMASLMWRSNQIIIRSGGISSLEQVALARSRQNARPKLWVHSTYRGDVKTSEILLKHTYAWERGNAEYLMQHLDAKMTAPQVIRFFEG